MLLFNEVSNNCLETLGIDLVAGRGFGPQDRSGAPLVAVVNETFANYFFPSESPIGKRFGMGERQGIEIIGVVRDVKVSTLREETAPLALLPLEQFHASFNLLFAKVDGPAGAMISAIRRAILEVDPKLRPDPLQTLDEALDRTLARDILLAHISGLFGTLSLALACFGVYGVISYMVAARTAEIGIRMALGAQRGHVLGHVIGSALRTVAPGIAAGVAVAVASERFIESLLFGATARDPLTYATVAAFLLLTTALAAFVPALRASRIAPVNALRSE